MALLTFLQSRNTPLSKEILDNLYVDNVLLGASTPSEAISKYKESKALLSEIGMNLREYSSNRTEVNDAIPLCDRAPSGISTILGVKYDKNSNEFGICLKFVEKDKLTKRDVVSQLNSIYDPIGIVGPITIRLKQLMREIYESGVGWNEPIPERLAVRWNATCQEYQKVSVSLPRHIGMPNNSSTNMLSLLVFADASAKALATCAYLRHEETRKVSTLISGKTRLTPKKTKQTIPKLEVVAILMATRLAKNIASAIRIKLNEINLLSDSEIALSWIKSSRKLPLFVENQKQHILKIKDGLESAGINVNFFHVRTADNPADAGTRGADASLIVDLPWVRGPQWLNNEKIPTRLRKLADIHEQKEVEEDSETLGDYATTLQLAGVSTSSNLVLISLARFSRLDKALRTVARVGKVLHAWVIKVNTRKESQSKLCLQKLHLFDAGYEITAEDVKLSETLLLHEAHASISLNTLKKRFPQKKIFRDENGIIRNASRIQNAPVPYDVKNPIYLEKDSDITRLVVTDIHIKNGHSGKDHTLCLARQRFWIPRPCGVFKKYLKNCVVCRKALGLPFGAPEMPPLPKDRTVLTRPFQSVGCDFMGPFHSKNNEKYYVSLYTCLTTRAVHLEVVEDMSTGAFLNSFIRFISRRGVPTIIRTDCGTNFKLGQQITEKMSSPNESTGDSVMSYSSNHRIQWVFNPPGAPWMGGAWERLVGSVKRAFTKSVGRKRLSHAQLYTIMTQIEAIINTRPLTTISNANTDDIPLRPIDFLQNSLKYSLAEMDKEEGTDPTFDPKLIQTATQAKQAIQHAEQVSSRFWDRWYTEYLTALREIQAINRKQPRHMKVREPQIDEIVLVEQENLPRGSWCYGKVVDLMRGCDDLVRSVKLLMPNKHVWLRPVNKLYPLEISAKNDKVPPNSPQAEHNVRELQMNEGNKPRLAKIKAKEAIQKLSRITDDSNGSLPPVLCPHINVAVVIMIAVLFLGPSVYALPNISCKGNALLVNPPNGTFQLCIRSTCRYFANSLTNLTFLLPATANNGVVIVSMRHFSGNKYTELQKNCSLPHVCDVSQNFMSKHLLGNPHCWPTGAIASIGMLLYLMISAIVLSVKLMLVRRGSHSGATLTSSESGNDNKGSHPTVAFRKND
ncbi:hypothetical protein V3C99_005119 [Haemonchus contortus]|uniref:Integrase catalytic domain-containing protein n=1 Tax=Haemonchus contortus TaxID=6289 RepID=A0A7I4XU25_HAECO